MNHRACSLAVITLATLAAASTARAEIAPGPRTIYVPVCPAAGPCTSAATIAQAITLANDGDAVVLTRTGTYPGFDFQGKDVLVASRWFYTGNPTDIAQTIVSGTVSFVGTQRTATLMALTVAGRVTTTQGYGTLDHVTVRNPPSGKAAVEVGFDTAILDSDLSGSDKAGVFHYGSARIDVDGTRIHGNAIGMQLYGGTLTVRDSLVDHNAGWGIWGYGTIGDIQGSEVRDNLGTGVYFRNQADLVMSHCRIIGNESDDHAGGIRLDYQSTVTLRDSYVAGNKARRSGGGIHVINVLVARQPLIERTVFAGNDAGQGGAINFVYGSPRLRNVVVVGNTAGSAAGIVANHVDGSGSEGGQPIEGPPGLLIENATIVGNRDRAPGYFGAGLADVFNSVVTVRNTILWGNNGAQASTADGILLDIDASDVQGGRLGVVRTPGEDGDIRYGPDNIAADPLLVDPPSPSALQDGLLVAGVPYHLAAGSPCIDSGRDASWMATGVDIDGQARIVGERVDMGADER